MKKRNDSSMLDAVLYGDHLASQAVLDAAMDAARKRCHRRRASLFGWSILIAALPLGWFCLRPSSDDVSRYQPAGPAVVQSPAAVIKVRTAFGHSAVRVVTAQSNRGAEEGEPAWRVRTEDVSPAQGIIKVSDDDLLLLAGRKQNGSSAVVVYAAEGMRFLVAESASPEPFH